MVAEIGVDMSVFPGRAPRKLGRRCPGNDQSAGKRRSGRTRKGSKWLGIALEEAALAATRTKNTYFAAQYQRLRPRIGHGRALGAVKHSMLVADWHMFTTGETYRELGSDYYQRRDPERAITRLVARLEELAARPARAVPREHQDAAGTGRSRPAPEDPRFCAGLLDEYDALWTFCEVISPTNNAAERALRHGVLLRKIRLGTQSEKGNRWIERVCTARETCRLQGRSVLGYLQDAATAAHHCQPIPSLTPT